MASAVGRARYGHTIWIRCFRGAVGSCAVTVPTSRQVSNDRYFHQNLTAPKLCSLYVRPFSSAAHEEYVIKSVRPQVTIPRIALHEFIWSKIDKWADKIAVECAVTGRKYTYSQARSYSRSLASALQNAYNLRPGDCFAILSPNLPEYPLMLLAASEAGVVATTVNPLYTAGEIVKQLQDSSAKLIITTPSCFKNAEDAISKLGHDIPVLVIEDSSDTAIPSGGVNLDVVIKASSGVISPVKSDADDNIVLPYSSGTTGLPKGVQLSHFCLVANLIQMDMPGVRLLLETTETQQDTVMGLLPMFHIYGMSVVALSTLLVGGKLVTVPRFEPKLFIDTLTKHKVAIMYLVPPLVLFLSGHPDVKAEHLDSIRVVNSGAAPIGHSDVVRLQKKAPHIMILQGYGMTETSPVTLTTCRDRIEKYGSVGIPLSNTDIKIIDVDTGKSLPQGEVGELLVRGPQVMKGYLNKADANESIFQNEWLRTGDLAYYDEDGDVFVVDRLKELIKVKGFQVAPAELEAILRSHPQVSDSAVIGVPDERSGEVPLAFVVPKPGQTVDEAAVAAFVAEKVADYKKLAGGVVVLSAIPKSTAGKILRKELRAKYSKPVSK